MVGLVRAKLAENAKAREEQQQNRERNAVLRVSSRLFVFFADFA